MQRFQADERLHAYLNVDPELLAKRLTKEVQAYGGHRFYSSLTTCLAPEIDHSLSALPLE